MNIKNKVLELQNNINKNIVEAWNIGKELSKEFGTSVNIETYKTDEFAVEEILILTVPRPCGCCRITLKEELYPYTENIKEIVLKMRQLEQMVVEKYTDDYDNMYSISIPLDIKLFLNKPIEEVFNIWEKYMSEFDEE